MIAGQHRFWSLWGKSYYPGSFSYVYDKFTYTLFGFNYNLPNIIKLQGVLILNSISTGYKLKYQIYLFLLKFDISLHNQTKRKWII